MFHSQGLTDRDLRLHRTSDDYDSASQGLASQPDLQKIDETDGQVTPLFNVRRPCALHGSVVNCLACRRTKHLIFGDDVGPQVD